MSWALWSFVQLVLGDQLLSVNTCQSRDLYTLRKVPELDPAEAEMSKQNEGMCSCDDIIPVSDTMSGLCQATYS